MTEGPSTLAPGLARDIAPAPTQPSRLDRAMRALEEAIDSIGKRVEATTNALRPLLVEERKDSDVEEGAQREVSGFLTNAIYDHAERIERLSRILGSVLSRLDV